MRGVSLVAIVLVAMLITPVQGTPIVDEVNMMQGGGNDDRQPTANNTTYWMFGSEGMDRGKEDIVPSLDPRFSSVPKNALARQGALFN